MLFTWVPLNVSYSVEERQEEEEEEEKNPPGRMHSGWKRSTSDKPVNMHERWSDPSCVPSEMELPRVWSSPILAASAYSSPAAQQRDSVDAALPVALSIAKMHERWRNWSDEEESSEDTSTASAVLKAGGKHAATAKTWRLVKYTDFPISTGHISTPKR